MPPSPFSATPRTFIAPFIVIQGCGGWNRRMAVVLAVLLLIGGFIHWRLNIPIERREVAKRQGRVQERFGWAHRGWRREFSNP